MRILLTGGGSGGHTFPLLAVVRELKKITEQEKIPKFELIYFGPDGGTEKILTNEYVRVLTLKTGKFRRYWSLLNIWDILRTIKALIYAVWELFWIFPDVIFSKGGYGSFPVVQAARIYRIPVIIHESDAIAGKVNLMAKKFAKRIAISFPETAKYFPNAKVALTGNPIRRELLGGDREWAESVFGLGGMKPVLVILGGSQGAQRLNEVVLAALPRLVKFVEIIHQTGSANFNEVRGEGVVELEGLPEEERGRWHPVGFLDELNLKAAYRVADIIISRAGSGAIFEIAAAGKPSLLIPLPESAQDHQRENAYAYARSGACIVLEQANLTANLLTQEVKKLVENEPLRTRLAQAARAFAKPDAAEIMAHEIINLAITHK